MKLSIIIVNYHAHQQIFECLDSLYTSQTQTAFEVIVIDNDEKQIIHKTLKKQYPQVIYKKSSSNKGFGAGNNIGATLAKGELLFFLNPDTQIKKGAVDELVHYLENNPNAGIVAPILLDTKGNVYPLQGTKTLTPFNGWIVLTFINKIFPRNPVSQSFFYNSWNKEHVQRVESVPGTALMIRKDLFNRSGMFDEKFFLYFEENDLCKRVNELGYESWIIPQSRVIHTWGESTKKSKRNIQEIFNKSRFYYFQKHFGYISALFIHLTASIGKNHVFIGSILLLAAWLRLYKIEEFFPFSGEVGHNLLAIKNAFENGYIPLLGPPTSHPWLSFAPLFYWLYGPVLYLSGFNPLSYAYFGTFISIVMIGINYFVIQKTFGQRIAIVSSFLMTVSPLFLYFSWGARFFSFVPVFSLLLFYIVYKGILSRKTYAFNIGMLFGLMFSFHYTPIMLFPFVITAYLLNKVSIHISDMRRFILGLAIFTAPLILYDLAHGFTMIKNVALWIPYRIAGFLGFIPKNTVSVEIIHENVLSIVDFFVLSIVPRTAWPVSIIVYSIVIIFITKHLIHIWSERDFKNPLFLMILMVTWGYIALFIHGSPPLHYFVPILFVPIILVSYVIHSAMRFMHLGLLLFIVMVVINIKFYYSSDWIFRSPNQSIVSYETQQQVARYIVNNAHGRYYTLRRVGIDDQFEGDYAQNYQYLLWLYGNEPVSKAPLMYTIYEPPYLQKAGKNVYTIQQIKIGINEK